MHTDMKFDAKDKPLSAVFFSDRKYRVPRYQRPYAWNDEQISEFWEDLITTDEPYFLGSMIFNTEHEAEEGYVDIIDGQQRLLTITILIAVFRDIAKGLELERARLYQRKDIAIEDRDGREFYRIAPAELLSGYFESFIQGWEGNISSSAPDTPEEERVKRNYEFFFEKVNAELKRFSSRDTQLEALGRLRKKIADLIVISVEIAREEDAYEIFETTNARGLELSVADLLKNLIFKRIRATDDRDIAKEIWQEITTNVESTDTELKRFIRYYWVSKYGFISEKKLYRAIKNRTTDWQGLLNELWDDSQRYNRLLESNDVDFQEFKHGYKIFESVSALRPMRVSQCYVLLLSIMRNFEKLGTDPTRIFQLVEKFTFQYSVVCKLPTNRIERIYSNYAIRLEEAILLYPDKKVSARVQSAFSELEKELKTLAPSEEVFKESFRDLSYRNSEDTRRLIKYILAKIDAYYRKTDEHRIDFNTVNIEHILPQNPSKDWKVSKKDIRRYVNKLGNLTLLSKKINSRVENAPISQKLPELAVSELAVTKQLVNELSKSGGEWNQKSIELRQEELGNIAYNFVWKL